MPRKKNYAQSVLEKQKAVDIPPYTPDPVNKDDFFGTMRNETREDVYNDPKTQKAYQEDNALHNVISYDDFVEAQVKIIIVATNIIFLCVGILAVIGLFYLISLFFS